MTALLHSAGWAGAVGKVLDVWDDVFNALFLEAGAGKQVRRDIFVELDPNVVEEAHGGTYR
jgi:hypothetical protein